MGNFYEGQFKDGKFHGKGIYHYSNGNKYDGEFIEGKQVGKNMFEKPLKTRSLM